MKSKFRFKGINFIVTLSVYRQLKRDTTQLTFTCSKSTIETLEKGVKYDQS